MFSEAYTYLNQALRQAQIKPINYFVLRDLLNAAKSAIERDMRQPQSLRAQASQAIDQAVSYTYSVRPNAFNFQAMTTPISPFQRNTMGPYGFSTAQFPETIPRQWTSEGREEQTLLLMIRNAINIVRQGLH